MTHSLLNIATIIGGIAALWTLAERIPGLNVPRLGTRQHNERIRTDNRFVIVVVILLGLIGLIGLLFGGWKLMSGVLWPIAVTSPLKIGFLCFLSWLVWLVVVGVFFDGGAGVAAGGSIISIFFGGIGFWGSRILLDMTWTEASSAALLTILTATTLIWLFPVIGAAVSSALDH